MTDRIFAELLAHTVNLSRPQVELEPDLQVATPTYELLAAGVAARVRPTAADVDRGLLGRFPRAVALAYLAPTDVEPNDRLGQVVSSTVLTQAALSGSDTLSVAATTDFAAGMLAHLLGAGGWEEVAITAVSDEETLELVEPLTGDFAEGDAVHAVIGYEVLGVVEEAGADHHLKVVLRHREI